MDDAITCEHCGKARSIRPDRFVEIGRYHLPLGRKRWLCVPQVSDCSDVLYRRAWDWLEKNGQRG